VSHRAELDELRQRLAQADAVCVLTGAGMSAESGIPTFRDALTGLWSRHDPMTLASEEGFRADPRLVWDWYAERRRGVRAAEPNAGHHALADWQRRHPGRMTIVSQNVDDLHQRAGSLDTLCLHGDILADRWLDPCPHARRASACATGQASRGRPPQCAECGNRVRPGVVWFGEPLPAAVLEAAERAVRHCALLLVVGTSGAVWPAAGFAAQARRSGAWVAVINPNPSDLDDEAHTVMRGTAARVLPDLCR
jgi:NAD-dependent deacetylase